MYKLLMIWIVFSVIFNGYNIEKVMNCNLQKDFVNTFEDIIKGGDNILLEREEVIGVEFSSEISEKAVKKAYEQMIMDDQADEQLIPFGTNVNKVIIIDNDLLVDFSSEFLNYGGTTLEYYLVEKILQTGFSFSNINSITISIDGEVKNLVEGTTINMYTRIKWEERNKVND